MKSVAALHIADMLHIADIMLHMEGVVFRICATGTVLRTARLLNEVAAPVA
jgi:hypothetical protein